MHTIWRISEFLKFYFKAKTLYNIHSPFLFELLKSITDISKTYYGFEKIEQVRTQLINNHKKLTINDKGAGSSIRNQTERTISSICKHSTSGEKKCRLIYNIVNYLKPKSIIELGTNLGIATSYIKIADRSKLVHTVDADQQLLDLAKQTFRYNDLSIVTCNSTFEAFFKDYSQIMSDSDLIYVDGNHTYEGTIRAYQQATLSINNRKVLIFDDIYWSKDMKRAWEEICSNVKSGYCIDLYIIGIVIIDMDNGQNENVKFIPWRYKPFSNGLLG